MRLILALLLAALPAGATQVFIDDVAGWEAALPGPYGRADFEAPYSGSSRTVTEGRFSITEYDSDDEWGPHMYLRDGKLFGSTWHGQPSHITFGAQIAGVLFDASYLQDGDIHLSTNAGDYLGYCFEVRNVVRVTCGVVFDAPVNSVYFRTGDYFSLEYVRWKPVPEPSTGLLLALGLLLLAKRH